MLNIISSDLNSFNKFKLFVLEISFTAASLLIGKQAFTLLSQAIYSTSNITKIFDYGSELFDWNRLRLDNG
ncbi:MAG: hypothetical protein LBC74_05810 [Planctomycetaceae bacterium]|nr:hypothetical protein [Planctomycetaceae bacterium]